MKRLLVIFLLLALAGCGDGGSTMQAGIGAEIMHWQEAERECLPYKVKYQRDGVPDMAMIEESFNEAITLMPVYQYSEIFHTSCESIQKHAGDCTDLAVLVYRLLREGGVSDNRLWIVGLKGQHHDVLLVDMGDFLITVDTTFNNVLYYEIMEAWPEYDYAFNLFVFF